MKKIFIILTVGLLVSGCEDYSSYPKYDTDQKIRRIEFEKCLAASPRFSYSGGKNYWTNVIDSCATAAKNLSLVCVENCPNIKKEEF